MSDELNLSMFRAYDIRTPSSQLTDDLAVRLAQAESVYFQDILGVDDVLVSYDARRTGPRYLTLAVNAYLQAGLNVIYLPGPASTSYFYFAAMCHPEAAAVMIGASHNPAGDTGQKILGPQVAPIAAGIGPEGGLDKIRELYLEAAAAATGRPSGRIRTKNLMSDFVRHSMQLAGVKPGSLKGVRLLHDYVFGAAGREMMLAFDAAAAELTPLHFVPDGSFPLGDPNPVKQDVIREGLRRLSQGDFHLASFFDGDGDRVDFYRDDGTNLSSSFVYAALLPRMRERFTGSGLGVFADLKCNPLAIIEMASTGVEVDVVRNGHSQIKQSLIDDATRFGAVEESAHFYESFSLDPGQRFCTENTLYIALLAARVWAEQPERIAKLFEIQQTTAREREWGYKFESETQRSEALAAVRELFQSRGADSMTQMKNGMDLEATLMRCGLPFDVNQDTQLSEDWLQICQRISQSENGLARWEVVGGKADLVKQAKRDIADCVAKFGAGQEYQG
jgi:phosphomannomutase